MTNKREKKLAETHTEFASHNANHATLSALPLDDRLIAASDLPDFIGLAAQTLARLRHEGHGPSFVRVGRRIFYRSTDVRDWLKQRTYNSTLYTDEARKEGETSND